jgi:hypothetical protein
LAGLEGYRGQSSEALHDRVKVSKCDKILNCHDTVKHAMIASLQTLQDETESTEAKSKETESKERGHNKILVIGSFLTVSAAEQALENIDGLIQVPK